MPPACDIKMVAVVACKNFSFISTSRDVVMFRDYHTYNVSMLLSASESGIPVQCE